MNYYIVFLAVVFGIIKIDFFGWNSPSVSADEVICNGIMILILALAMIKLHGKS